MRLIFPQSHRQPRPGNFISHASSFRPSQIGVLPPRPDLDTKLQGTSAVSLQNGAGGVSGSFCTQWSSLEDCPLPV